MLRTVDRAGRRWVRPALVLLATLAALLAALATRTAGATPPFTPVADSYVDTGQGARNFGTATQLRVDGSPEQRAYLRFDPQGLSGPVTKATLMLHTNSGHAGGYFVHGVKDVTWGETTITAGNAPPLDPAVTDESGPFATGVWATVDVTALVRGPGPVSFALVTPDSIAMSLASRESGATAPQLLVETSGSADSQAPSIPANLRSTAVASTQVSLAWDAATDNVGVTGYRVFR
ncbi:MAG: hypothetical protein QOK40_3098, partial [Miltoncostaeaceae bacterium]|nr:hypothetical protein [Miltoncostaeaceae bacterium]